MIIVAALALGVLVGAVLGVLATFRLSTRPADNAVPPGGWSPAPAWQSTAVGLALGERRRQDGLAAAGRIPWTLADPAMPDAARLDVLAKQLGDVLRVVGDDAKTQRELAQLAASALAWIERLLADARRSPAAGAQDLLEQYRTGAPLTVRPSGADAESLRLRHVGR